VQDRRFIEGIHVVTVTRSFDTEFKKTLDTILSQTIQPKLWVVVTPSHSPWPFEILPEYVKIIKDSGLGVYSAMNKYLLINEANVGFVLFLNSGDEFINQDSLKNLTCELALGTSSLYFSQVSLHRKNGETIANKFPSKLSLNAHVIGFSQIPHSGVLIDSVLFRSIGGFDESLRIAGDIDLFIRATQLVTPQYIAKPFSRFYLGGLSSQKRFLNQVELFIVRRKMQKSVFSIHLINLFFLIVGMTRAMILVTLSRVILLDWFRDLCFKFLQAETQKFSSHKSLEP
jgi:hypothetical protein